MWLLGPLGFTAPWMLLGLASLPVIWWLLRVTPPSPRRVVFPPVRILRSLQAEEETPARTPLWLTLLRMLLAALAVLALAGPVLNPRSALPGSGALTVIVDNGWAAAAGWQQRQTQLEDLLSRAERENRPVLLLPTAAPANGSRLEAGDLMPAAAARRQALALNPLPWSTSRAEAARALSEVALPGGGATYWLSDGLDDGAATGLAETLAGIGTLHLMRPDPGDDALALTPPEPGASFTVTVLRAQDAAPRNVWVRASAAGGRLLARAPAEFAAGETQASAQLELPPEARNDAERIFLENVDSAGAVALLDERWRRRPVGLASGAAVEERAQPLLSGLYYLERALTPFAEVRSGDLEALLTRPLSVLILADIGRLSDDQVGQLRAWVEDGGLLIRFAGPHLAENADALLPVRLRRGGRILGGALSWSEPARLAPFAESSPFHGLALPPDVLVRQQVLAQPSLELDGLTWARLADGTPLVTGQRMDRGYLVLFHITANADWSNLPLSGLFVEMLQRLVALSRGVAGDQERGVLAPLAALDGFGRLGTPQQGAQPVAAAEIAATAAGPDTPPGFYGTEQNRRALNLANGWQELAALPALNVPHTESGYALAPETALKPWLLTAAVVLALLDLLAMLALRGFLRLRPGSGAGAGSLALALALLWQPGGTPARAQQADAFALAATGETRLAYVRTGNADVDETSRAGLIGLSDVLTQRTSVEPGDPMAVDVEHDELSFFPLLYWPITPDQPRLSGTAVARASDFMRTGGTILFDTRDARMVPRGPARGFAGGGAASERLRRLLRRLDVPPLAPVPQDHVLTKAFYLMQSFPGRYADGAVWVERGRDRSKDGVSPIIIGGNDWAAAWAVDGRGRPLNAVIPGGERQRDMAFRFGVNLVMYTLTGNYKADQVHVPAILERLGQ